MSPLLKTLQRHPSLIRMKFSLLFLAHKILCKSIHQQPTFCHFPHCCSLCSRVCVLSVPSACQPCSILGFSRCHFSENHFSHIRLRIKLQSLCSLSWGLRLHSQLVLDNLGLILWLKEIRSEIIVAAVCSDPLNHLYSMISNLFIVLLAIIFS